MSVTLSQWGINASTLFYITSEMLSGNSRPFEPLSDLNFAARRPSARVIYVSLYIYIYIYVAHMCVCVRVMCTYVELEISYRSIKFSVVCITRYIY